MYTLNLCDEAEAFIALYPTLKVKQNHKLEL